MVSVVAPEAPALMLIVICVPSGIVATVALQVTLAPPTDQPIWKSALFGTTTEAEPLVVVAATPVTLMQLKSAANVVRDTILPLAKRYPEGAVAPDQSMIVHGRAKD